MCCVCSLISKIISFAISVLFIVALILLILWLTGVLFTSDDSSSTAGNQRFVEGVTGAGLKHFVGTT